MNLLATRFDQLPGEQNRYRNSLIGLAAGDAWGYQYEFTQHSRMPDYPAPAPTATWVVSDDTQMAIALGDALADLTTADQNNIDTTTDAIVARFLDWQADPDNDRAPGTTCLGSLAAIRNGRPWHHRDGARTRRGCGAIMRVAPAAFADDDHWAGLAALQAIITHKHPAAVLSAMLVADAIRNSRSQVGGYLSAAMHSITALFDNTHQWCTDPYLAQVLAPVLKRPDGTVQTVRSYLLDGLYTDASVWNEDTNHNASTKGGHRRSQKKRANGPAADTAILDGSLFAVLLTACEVSRSYSVMRPEMLLTTDVCRRVGEGWDAPSAAALALLVADIGTNGPLTPQTALAWAATSNGDSDSIAAVAGAILGAMSTVPNFWEQEGLTPTFESRYALAIATAPAASMALGQYPDDVVSRHRRRHTGEPMSFAEAADDLYFGESAPTADSLNVFDAHVEDVHDGFSDVEADLLSCEDDGPVDLDAAIAQIVDIAPLLPEDDPAVLAAAADFKAGGLPDSSLDWDRYLHGVTG